MMTGSLSCDLSPLLWQELGFLHAYHLLLAAVFVGRTSLVACFGQKRRQWNLTMHLDPKKNDLVFGLWPGVLYISPSTSSSHWPGTCVAARAAANSHRRRQLELNGIKTLQLCGPQEVSTMILMVLGMVWQFFPWKIQGLFRLVFSRFPLGWHLCWGAFKFSVVDSAGFYRILIGFKLNLMTCEFTHGLQETRRDSWRRGVLWKFFTWFWQHA